MTSLFTRDVLESTDLNDIKLIDILKSNIHFPRLFNYLPKPSNTNISSIRFKHEFLYNIANQPSDVMYNEFINAILQSQQFELLQYLPLSVSVEKEYILSNLQISLINAPMYILKLINLEEYLFLFTNKIPIHIKIDKLIDYIKRFNEEELEQFKSILNKVNLPNMVIYFKYTKLIKTL